MTVSVSVVVPAFNEAEHIRNCLVAISDRCKEAGVDVDIVVVDNGSTDGTTERAAPYTEKVVRIGRASVSTARNHGVEVADHDIIAFIDADVVVTRAWANTIVDRFARFIEEPLFITGHQYAVRDDGSWIERYWFANLRERLLAGGNMITSRTVIERIQGFDERRKTGEDYDFCVRAIEIGAAITADPGFHAVHLGYPRTAWQFLKRECWHGESDFTSLRRFIRSPVALLAVSYVLVQLGFLAALFMGELVPAMIAAGLLLVGNLGITARRFRGCGAGTVAINSILNYGYFCARAASPVRAFSNRRKGY